MEIPLKSKPKVLMAKILDESAFQTKEPGSVPSTGPLVHASKKSSSSSLNPSRIAIDRGRTEERMQIDIQQHPNANYKLARTYSETETNNFDLETGHRLFDDGKIRPSMLRHNSPVRGLSKRATTDLRSKSNLSSISRVELNNLADSRPGSGTVTPRLYTRSHEEIVDGGESDMMMNQWGMEDEYIPGLDFGDMVYRWNQTKDELSRMNSRTTISPADTPQSREGSYLDLNLLHLKVAPQPINRNQGGNVLFLKLSDFMRLRTPQGSTLKRDPPNVTNGVGNETSNKNFASFNLGTNKENQEGDQLNSDDPLAPPKPKRQRSQAEVPTLTSVSVNSDVVNPSTGAINYENLLNSLPTNFNDLPYSQRKKIIKSYSELIDYSQFSLIAKQFFSDKYSASQGSSGSSNGRLQRGSSFLRKSRRSSTSTVAGRLLALSSSSDLNKMAIDQKPKENVDEKGALVLGYELGKVIGFGAWGTIRECKNVHNTEDIKACKIVHSCRIESSSSTGGSMTKHNPKVLERFRQEINIWQKLHHPNILLLLNHLETDTTIFCISDRINGGTLFELVSDWGVFNGGIYNSTGPLGFLIQSQRERLINTKKMACQIADALYYMHQRKGIVHGDIKLENVLVENRDSDEPKMILCDFGMSRIYSERVSRRNSLVIPMSEDMGRSKSSMTTNRKPLIDKYSSMVSHLFKDDSKIGVSQFARTHGPSLQSIDLTPTQSSETINLSKHVASDIVNDLKDTNKPKETSKLGGGIESNLPHLHIGSLPYASPELILPSPPPLGPSADIWAFGVLLYTMIVGKLPFQHQYEPRLRAIISAGKYDKQELRRACLLEFVFDGERERHNSIQSSFMDLKRQEEIENLTEEWKNHDTNEFDWMFEIISGCLELNITKRLDLEVINNILNA